MDDYFIVRDLRNKQFFMVDDMYLNGFAKVCGINATGVYCSLCRHANKQQTCFPSKKLIAEELAISERSVYSAILKLSEHRIIRVKEKHRLPNGKFKSLTYVLLDKKHWKKLPSATSADGKIKHSPSETGAVSHRQQVPSKGTHLKETHIRIVNLEKFKPEFLKRNETY